MGLRVFRSRSPKGNPNQGAPAVALLVLLAQVPTALGDDFIVNDRLVSDPASDLPQPEFDGPGDRMFWASTLNELWVARVDPLTGDISPADGKLLMIDSGLAPVGQIGNTPRISYGEEDILIYTRREGTKNWLAVARNVDTGVWLSSLLARGEDRFRANGTPEEFTGVARMVYNRDLPGGNTVVAWRDWNDPNSEVGAQVIGQGGRFLGDEPFVLTLLEDAQGIIQIYLIDLATGLGDFITSGPPNKVNPFVWFAPEFQDWTIVTMLGFTELAVFRRDGASWLLDHQFTIPSEKPFLSSPEAFVHNGVSYVAVVTADELGTGDSFPGQPLGPSEIWIAGIDAAQPFFRRIDDPANVTQKAEPEPYQLATGSV
ncbi:MAG: hypothetical protein AAFX85_18750, partial [Pseudomonadota bacterium]